MGSLPSAPAVLISFATLIFAHAAFSAWEARRFAKALGAPIQTTFGSPLPVDIIAEALVSFALLVSGVAWSAVPLKEISWASEMATRSIDSEDSRQSFASLRHRGNVLFVDR